MDLPPRPTVVPSPDGVAAPPPADPTGLPVGTVFGGYRIVKPVGRGGMGHVYEAFDADLSRTVAVKTLLPKLAADPDTRDRFLTEARALAAVSNDFVVTVHEVGESGGLPFLVMAYLTGESLDARMKRGPLPLLQVVKCGREVANGLAAAHQAGLVHRDVKPDNIFLDARLDRAVLIDFGLVHTARAVGDSATALAGTPLYMSPEQVRGEPVDARSDLFSLGVVLYRLCTERWPYFGATLGEWRKRMLSGDPPVPVEQLNPAVPPPLADLIRRLLARGRDARPATAAAVEWELLQLYQNLLAMTHSGAVANTTRWPAVSQPTLVALESAEPRPRARRRWPWWVGGGAAVAAVAAIAAAVVFRPSGPTPPTEPVVGRPTDAPPDRPTKVIRTAPRLKPEPVPLFDGRTLTGWHGVEGKTDQWLVKNGVLVGTPKPRTKDGRDGDQFLLTDREFTDYELTVEFRWPTRGGHTTVLLRAKDEGPTAVGEWNKDQHRVTGLELNLGDDGDDPPAGHKKPANPLYASGGFYKLRGPQPPAPNKPVGEWNAVTVTSDRSRLTVEWNGVVTFDEDLDRFARLHKELPALARSKGAIALRTHGGKPVEFRSLVVTPIGR